MTSQKAHELFNALDEKRYGFDLIASENCPMLEALREKELTIVAEHGDNLYECQDNKGATYLIKGDEYNENPWAIPVHAHELEEANAAE